MFLFFLKCLLVVVLIPVGVYVCSRMASLGIIHTFEQYMNNNKSKSKTTPKNQEK